MKDLAGLRFGKLIAIQIVEKTKRSDYKWLCRCDCGNYSTPRASSLTGGLTKSCGCYSKEVATHHGMKGTRPYRIWNHMKSRCLNKNAPKYKDYGGRGITICDKWLTFEGFWEDMQEGYKDDLTLDRINVNGNYEISNCRWITNLQQQSNKRNNKIVTYQGYTDTLANICRKYNANYKKVQLRLSHGWPIDKALEEYEECQYRY